MAPLLWRERFASLIAAFSRGSHRTPGGQLLAAETIAWALRTLAADAVRAGLSEPAGDDRIDRLLEEMERENLWNQRLSVYSLSRRAGLSQTAFRSRFARATAKSPRRYMEEQRIARAQRLLRETDRTIRSVALSVGYDDPYHFSRVFRRVCACSPEQWRQTALSSPSA